MKQITHHHQRKRLVPPQKRKAESHHNQRVKVLSLVVALLLVAILLSWAMTSFGATGRAIQTVEGYRFNLTLIDNRLLVSVNPSDAAGNSKTVDAISFNLTANFDVCTHSTSLLLGWEFPLDRCSAQEIEFGYATIDPSKFKTYRFDAVEFTFPSMPYGDIVIDLSELRVWDTSSGAVPLNLFASDDAVSVRFFRDTPVVALATGGGLGSSSSSSGGGGGGSPSPSGSSIECIRQWDCTEWTECKNGQQRRSCRDEHNCAQNTSVKIGYKIYPVIPAGLEEPAETRYCQEGDLQQLAQILQQEQGQQEQQPETRMPRQPNAPKPSTFLQKYKVPAIAIVSSMLVILLLIITVIHHRHKPQYNYDELKAWIRKERAAGTLDSDISEIIQQKTSWRKEEVQQMFDELGKM